MLASGSLATITSQRFAVSCVFCNLAMFGINLCKWDLCGVYFLVCSFARTRTHNTCLHTHTPVCVFTGEFGKIGHESLTMLAVSPFPISFESDVFRLPTVLLLFKLMVEWVCKI